MITVYIPDFHNYMLMLWPEKFCRHMQLKPWLSDKTRFVRVDGEISAQENRRFFFLNADHSV
jgi:hypothetical protein